MQLYTSTTYLQKEVIKILNIDLIKVITEIETKQII